MPSLGIITQTSYPRVYERQSFQPEPLIKQKKTKNKNKKQQQKKTSRISFLSGLARYKFFPTPPWVLNHPGGVNHMIIDWLPIDTSEKNLN